MAITFSFLIQPDYNAACCLLNQPLRHFHLLPAVAFITIKNMRGYAVGMHTAWNLLHVSDIAHD
jgi:hypothetical protein